MSESQAVRVRVKSMTWLAINVLGVTLETLDGQALPAFTAGSHIDLRLSPKLSRSYSIVGHGGMTSRYEIAVAKDAKSRGGSKHVHEVLRVGDEVQISEPRNLFALSDAKGPSVLIAGGIGITPIWAMVQHLEAVGRPWLLCYAARSRAHAAYINEIESLAARSSIGQLITHFDDAHAGAPLNLAALLATVSRDAQLYCCGPQPMLSAFESAAAPWPAAQVHLERFTVVQPAADAGEFKLVLQRSGIELMVPAARSILDVMLGAGINAQYGCMQGACGMCEVPVLDGVPEHLDHLLSDDVKQANRSMLICCSRSRTPTLTLDA